MIQTLAPARLTMTLLERKNVFFYRSNDHIIAYVCIDKRHKKFVCYSQDKHADFIDTIWVLLYHIVHWSSVYTAPHTNKFSQIR